MLTETTNPDILQEMTTSNQIDKFLRHLGDL